MPPRPMIASIRQPARTSPSDSACTRSFSRLAPAVRSAATGRERNRARLAPSSMGGYVRRGWRTRRVSRTGPLVPAAGQPQPPDLRDAGPPPAQPPSTSWRNNDVCHPLNSGHPAPSSTRRGTGFPPPPPTASGPSMSPAPAGLIAFLGSDLAERQPDAERRAAGHRVERQRAVVAVDDDPAGRLEAEPVPLPTSFVVKNDSKTRACSSGGMPGPSSLISTTAQPPRGACGS